MTKHGFRPFDALVERVRDEAVDRWVSVEREFIEVVEHFDAEFAKGHRDPGWYQAKARYFNDIIVHLLANASQKAIAMRCKKRSQLFDLIDIDICHPEEDPPIVAGEVKALGTPPHPRNQGKPRGGSADLHKRVREVAFTSMDLKAAYAHPQPIASFQQWVETTRPAYFSFWAIRANDANDLERVRSTLSSLRAYCNGVGAVVYCPKSGQTPTKYDVRKLTELSIDRALREMAQRIS
jgi:hypothetical protein